MKTIKSEFITANNMEKKKKVYIRGYKGRGSEVQDILTRLGATNAYEVSCEDENSIYFINHKNTITCALVGSEVVFLVMDNFKEIHLPRRWKDGDVLINIEEIEGHCFNEYTVFKKYKNTDTFEAYFDFYNNINVVHFDSNLPVGTYRLASPAEKRKIPMLFYFLLNNLDAVRKCLPKEETEE